ncbi:MAG TPA: PQQ-dependent sugar dehydrogenase [Pseudonocardia sp.]|nr:PQQ-dependent sugar dehydrogenase [Pseudonocardia sp.]
MDFVRIGLLAPLLAVAVGCAAPAASSVAPVAEVAAPALEVAVVADGLSDVWDIAVLPDGRALVTERDGRITLLSGTQAGATATPVQADLADVYARGEGGLMGMVAHPDFATSRLFTTCQTHAAGGRPVDIRLVTWQLSADGRSATRIKDPMVGGLPINPSGRHSGCRPTVAPDGALLVGTGDTARGDLPQNRGSLGGKVLRVDLATGGPAPGNPFPEAPLVLTLGHRNVQGVAIQPGTGRAWTAEHGPTVDDEVNAIVPGGNYGWDPARGGTRGGYDESVPMTDLERYPDARAAAWSSGRPVEATSGASFLPDGRLAVAALRGEKLLLMNVQGDRVADIAIPAELDGTYGRLRAVRTAPDGALLVSTSNGGDDKVLRVTPA